MMENMMQQTSFGAESARWPSTRQNWPITTPPVPGMHTATPSAPPDGWQLPSSTSLPGLESLTLLDKVIIDQHNGYGICPRAKYSVMSVTGQKLFDVEESSSCLSRMCCGNSREFDIKVYDMSKKEVLGLHRPITCCLGQFDVYSGERQVGSIHQQCSLAPNFEIRDECGNAAFQVDGPCLDCYCFGTVREFQVYDADRSRQISLITRERTGLMRRLFTRDDLFNVSFPVNLDAQKKALLMATAILIDVKYYEED